MREKNYIDATLEGENNPFKNEPGWHGAFTRAQVPGAKYRNGARVRKADSEEGDTTPNGELGTVLGSVQVLPLAPAYFVEWDESPRVAVFVVEWKIGPA